MVKISPSLCRHKKKQRLISDNADFSPSCLPACLPADKSSANVRGERREKKKTAKEEKRKRANPCPLRIPNSQRRFPLKCFWFQTEPTPSHPSAFSSPPGSQQDRREARTRKGYHPSNCFPPAPLKPARSLRGGLARRRKGGCG